MYLEADCYLSRVLHLSCEIIVTCIDEDCHLNKKIGKCKVNDSLMRQFLFRLTPRFRVLTELSLKWHVQNHTVECCYSVSHLLGMRAENQVPPTNQMTCLGQVADWIIR